MPYSPIFHPDFIAEPYWWQEWRPEELNTQPDLPETAQVVVIGAGYSGVSTAMNLARRGMNVVIVEADYPGYGASTRNGGGVSAGVRIGKSLSGRRVAYATGEKEAYMTEAAEAYGYLEQLLRDEEIHCHWQPVGRFIGAWTPAHFLAQQRDLTSINTYTGSGSYMLTQAEQQQEIATTAYYGGQVIERSALVQPALLYRSLLGACIKAGANVFSNARVNRLKFVDQKWHVETAKGTVTADHVVVATNGYTGKITPDLRRGIIAIASNIIVTEELPAGMAQAIFPKGKMINDTARIRGYYRLTPDGKRLLFGGRGKFGPGTVHEHSEAIFKVMLKRLPQMADVRIQYGWSGNVAFTFDAVPHIGSQGTLHYLLGCNGSGVAMMTFLGRQIARKIAGEDGFSSAFERPLPKHLLYTGNTWFLPWLGEWFKFLDRRDSRAAARVSDSRHSDLT